ncbi:MAG TPA: hypothetical protein VFE55_21620 [Acidimicrobiia bacterium]|nr:hypothetical protein [Acidimicrobiia bacterium]
MVPRLPVHGVRRLGGGVLVGFGLWLDIAATREWKQATAAIAAGRSVTFGRLPGRVQSGLVTGLGLGLLLLEFAHRR